MRREDVNLSTLQTMKEFLSSIAPVTTTDYQVRSSGGALLYDTGQKGAEGFGCAILDQFFSQVLDRNAFLYSADPPHGFVCGRPMAIDAHTPAVLLAYGPMENGTAPDEHRLQLEAHLNHAVALVEENMSGRAEVQELALQLEHSYDDLYLFDRISSQIKSLQLSEALLHNLMVEIAENMQVDAAFVTLSHYPEFSMQIVRPESDGGMPDTDMFLATLEEMATPINDEAKENYFIMNDSRQKLSFRQLAPSPYRFLMVGVRHHDKVFGKLGLVSFSMSGIFRQGQLRMLKAMARQLAIVIANTELYADLRRFTVNTVSSLVSAIEAKDTYTRGHSERVHHYSMLLGRHIGLKDEALEALNGPPFCTISARSAYPKRYCSSRES